MNTRNKYGKVRWNTTRLCRPSALREAVLRIQAHAVGMQTLAQLSAIRSATGGHSVAKKLAMAKTALAGVTAINKVLQK